MFDLLGSILGAGGGLIGNLLGEDDYKKDMANKSAALAQIMGIPVPDAQALMVNLSKQQSAGQINPELQGTVTQGASAMQDVQVDPRLRTAQMNALGQLEQLGNTGLTAADRLALNQIQQQTSGQAQALNKSALAQAAQRGMAGSGASLAAQLIGSQGAANQGAQAGLNIASQAQQKALQAMSNAGVLGSQMEAQQFGEEAQKASAADAIARFNAANRQGVIGQNVGAKNQAQYYNLNNLQNVMNNNTAIANQQAVFNSQAQQQAYQNAMAKAQAAAGQFNKVGDQHGQQAQNTAGMWAGIGQGVNSALSAAGRTQQPSNQGTNNTVPQQQQQQQQQTFNQAPDENANRQYIGPTNEYGQY